MAGLMQGGIMGRIGRATHGNPIKKKLFGEKGTDFAGLYEKPAANPNDPTFTPAGTPNQKGKRKGAAGPATTADPSNPLGGV